MIYQKDSFICLETKELSYIFEILPSGHLEHVYFGTKTKSKLTDLKVKITAGAGSQVLYSDDHPIPLDLLPLEYSFIGKGDYRLMPFEAKMPNGSFVCDFKYKSHTIIDDSYDYNLPHALNADKTIIVTLYDEVNNVEVDLIYSTFFETNTITRKLIIRNMNENTLVIRKVMSMMIDVPEMDYNLITFDGGWIKETHKHIRPLSYGTYSIESTTGASSNRHNPGFILAKKDTNEDYGIAIGINLVYSGNHYSAVHVSNHGMMRVMTGINPHCFEWPLEKNAFFETPEAVLTYSAQGLNKLSHNMHDFINGHIVPKNNQKELRPIVLNNWEAFMFDFNQRKIINLARKAKKLGVEMFVLDDGWFSNRNDDTKGLGDYDVNRKKLPSGLDKLAKKINRMKMGFGLWFEPEMVNQDSKLFTMHPEFAVKVPYLEPSKGRNQLVLDLCNDKVVRYIKENLFNTIDCANISYIKWDMNRHISDMYSNKLSNQGMFFHKYILGLYDILKDLKTRYPHILLETCSSGGNRFDLGMLTFGPQVWASDNTDPMIRLKIQEGLSYLYPLSTISCHVSEAPHAQTLRKTPLETCFNVASFGVLGYELDVRMLKPYERKAVKEQISFYKKYRNIFQYGKFYRFNRKGNGFQFQVSKDDTHIIGRYQTIIDASPNFERLYLKNVNEANTYSVYSKPNVLNIDRFGHLIKHAVKVPFKHDGLVMRTIGKYKTLDNAQTKLLVDGAALKNGVPLKQQFMGTYYNTETRLLGDYGSELYVAEKIEVS